MHRKKCRKKVTFQKKGLLLSIRIQNNLIFRIIFTKTYDVTIRSNRHTETNRTNCHIIGFDGENDQVCILILKAPLSVNVFRTMRLLFLTDTWLKTYLVEVIDM